MSVASPSAPPIARSPEGEPLGDAGPARRPRRPSHAPLRSTREARAASGRRASVRPAPIESAVSPRSAGEARPSAEGGATAPAALTLVYFDPRTLEARSLVLPLRTRTIAALACTLLFALSTALGFVVATGLARMQPGRLIAGEQRLGGPVLQSFFASVPGLDGFYARRAPTPAREPPSVVRARAERLGLGTVATASSLLGGVARPEWIEAAAVDAPSIDSLRWPVDEGWFVRGYGSGEGGYHLAVDVAAPVGYRVRAAADGIVAYADDAIRGFGNLLLLVHPNGWITLYAHNSKHHVAVGERVVAGQLIAEVGNTGISRGPHVHFELMHHGKNCDPAPLFRPGMRHRDGARSEVVQWDWNVADGRPAQIRCGRRRIHPHSARFHDHDELESHPVGGELDVDAPSARVAPREPVATEG